MLIFFDGVVQGEIFKEVEERRGEVFLFEFGQVEDVEGDFDISRSFLFRTKGLEGCWIDFEVGALEEVDAVGDSGEDGIEAFADGFGFAGEVDEEGLVANPGGLAAEDGGGDVLQAGGAHEFAESRHHFVADGFCGFRGDVAVSRPGAASGDDEATVFLVHEFDEGRFDLVLLIGDEAVAFFPRAVEVVVEGGFDGFAGEVFVDTC